MEKIFIIAGKARQGKDTVYEFIKEYYKEKKVLYLPNNYYMRDYAKRIMGWNGSDEDKPRDLLIKLGDIARNEIDKHFFIKRTIDDIYVFSSFYDIIVLPDARFPYEIEMMKEKYSEAISINVIRPNYISEISNDAKKHTTETSLDSYDKYDYKIINNGTLEDLKKKVFDLLDKIEVK